MNKLKDSIFSKVASFFTLIALLLVVVGPSPAIAASVTAFSVLLTREQASTLSNQTITFTTPTGIASGATLVLTYDNTTSIPAALDFEDIDIKDDGTDRTLVSGAPGADVQVVRTSSTVITFTNGTTVFAAGSVIEIQIGTHATFGSTGAEQITNGPAGQTNLVLSGTFGDSGTAAMSIIDDDTVAVTATVNSSITFDLDTAGSDDSACDTDETAGPYTIALGTITTSDSRISGATDAVNLICVDLDTNASGGAAITVNNANGASGLVSTSTPADDIDTTDNTAVTAGTENYGLCVVTATQSSGTLDDEGGYNGDTCAVNSATNVVQAMSATVPETIFDTNSAPIAGGRGTIAVNASITGVQPAHSDYTDAITFIATGTF
jgi:hypothetical protein